MNINQNNCENCPVHNLSNLVKLGVEMDGYNYIVALAGNPNTGKSTVFNNLTGLRQHTGNWPGKTVARGEGGFEYNENKYKLVDLPGTYSLLSTSTDEEVARNFILFGQPDVTVIVVDATKLERNLNLVLQILEITNRAVLCLNLIDEAKRKDIVINDRELSKQLGIPVVPTSARSREGMDMLLNYIHQVATGEYVCKPYQIKGYTKKIRNSIGELTEKIHELFPDLPNARWVAIRLLEGDQTIIDAVKSGEIGQLIVTSSDNLSKVI
ncbi:MAG: 50S ribosome-binding GTPase [Melioribacteraceae bacterium]|nr:50S ribosome-binding GTPase [Melioribacteraceae bacterium]